MMYKYPRLLSIQKWIIAADFKGQGLIMRSPFATDALINDAPLGGNKAGQRYSGPVALKFGLSWLYALAWWPLG